MRIVVTALGSQGDVQPFAALSVALAGRGHDVVLITHGEFAQLVAGTAISVVPVAGDIRKDLGEAGKQMFAEGASPRVVAKAVRDMSMEYAESWTRTGLEASQGADVLVPSGASAFLGASLSEKAGIPYVQAYAQPSIPTHSFPSPLGPPPPANPKAFGNWLGSWLIGLMFWQVLRPAVNSGRRILDLPPFPFVGPYWRMRRDGWPVLLCHSPSVLPSAPDWPAQVKVTGYWWLDHPDWIMPDDLARFLADGPPPVYIGFGSMMPGDPAATTSIILEAVRRAGCRAVLAGGWGGLRPDNPPKEIFALDGAPHDRLLPHMAAVIHHGGAGTTAAGLRAGVPAVIVPFLADQFFWAWRLEKLGVSGGTLRHRDLDAGTLAAAIRRTLDDCDMRRRASALGAKVRAEDGLGEAVRIIEAVGKSVVPRTGA